MLSGDAQSAVDRKLPDHPDIRKLRESWCQFGYVLIFWMDDVQAKQDLKACFESLHRASIALAHEDAKLRFYCACRDGSIFKVPSTPEETGS